MRKADEKSSALQTPFEKLEDAQTTSESSISNFDPIQSREETRSSIAQFFVKSYFYLIGGFFLITLAYNLLLITMRQNESQINVKDLLLVVTSAVGTPLGFVVGYYFKGEEQK